MAVGVNVWTEVGGSVGVGVGFEPIVGRIVGTTVAVVESRVGEGDTAVGRAL